MKRLVMTLVCAAFGWGCLPGHAAMSLPEVRRNARFLSDRMAYELNLSAAQYGDVYEINYDFLAGIRFVMDGVVRGDGYATDRYYECLDMRNEDLSYVLSRRQYLAFAGKEYFYRPVYADRRTWQLRIYGVYVDIATFYCALPVGFYTYSGLHSRHYYQDGYYRNRYHHEMYRGPLCRIRGQENYGRHRQRDFNMPLRPERREQPGRPNNVPPHRQEHNGRPQARPDNPSRQAPSVSRPERREPSGKQENARPRQQESNKKPQARPNSSSRPASSVSRSDRPKENRNSSKQDTGTRRSGASRR